MFSRKWAMSLLSGFVLACMCALSLSCSLIGSKPAQRELVFQAAPYTSLQDREELGFVGSRGTQLEYRNIIRFGGLIPVWRPGTYDLSYRWSALANSSYSDGRVFVVSGSSARDCMNSGFGRIRWTPNGAQLLSAMYSTETRGEEFLALMDPSDCQVLRVLVRARSDQFVFDPDLSVRGQLVYVIMPKPVGTGPEEIVLADLESGESKVLAEGISPAWSPDGEWIAYTARDGIYLMRRNGTERRILLDYSSYWPEPWGWYLAGNRQAVGWPARPEWSPDGKWIVYHRPIGEIDGEPQFAIFKMNVATGEEVKIVDDGINPHWRWDSVGSE